MKKILLSSFLSALILLGGCSAKEKSDVKKETAPLGSSINEGDNNKGSKKETQNTKEYKIGDKVSVMRDGKEAYTITITGVELTDQRSKYASVDAQNVVLVSFTYENTGLDEQLSISETSHFKIYDSNGTALERYGYTEQETHGKSVSKGRNSSTTFSVALNSDKLEIEIEFLDGYIADVPAAVWKIKL